MHPTRRSTRRREAVTLKAEMLESRRLLTGGFGNTFAIARTTIPDTNGTAQVSYTIDPTLFTLPKRKFALGIDVAADSNSTAQALITSVNDSTGAVVPQTFHSIYDPHLTHAQVAAGSGTSAVITPAKLFPNRNDPVTYTVTTTAKNNTSGPVLVGFFLPGDANGDGKVDQTDIATIKSELGSVSGDSRYTFDADTNRDGRIGLIDLVAARQNLGVATTVTPVVTSTLDPATDSGAADRVTNQSNVRFTGTATPGATVTYTEINNKSPVVTTTADASGNYVINETLALGTSTFQVTVTDAFGQTISGQIAPVTFTTQPVSTVVNTTT